MLVPIIITAVIAFLIIVCIIYFGEIKSFFKKKVLKKKAKPEEKPKETKNPAFTVEDFKPIVKSYDEETRDLSVEQFFKEDEFESLLEEDNCQTINEEDIFSNFSNIDKSQPFSEHEMKEFNNIFGKKFNTNNKNKSISSQIKNLSPELKALLIDNVLKRRDDV